MFTHFVAIIYYSFALDIWYGFSRVRMFIKICDATRMV